MSVFWQVGWSWHPSVLIGMALWTASYVLLVGPLRRRNNWGAAPSTVKQITFHLGTLAGLVALVSPLDALGDEYLFSAHMLQHLILMFVTAPMWVSGIPGWLPGLLLSKSATRRLAALTQPMGALVVLIAVMVGWHLPRLYDLSQHVEGLHIVQHLMYIGAAMIGWWPVAGPEVQSLPKPGAPVQLLYLFILALPMTLLGALFTFAHEPIYSFYVHAPHPFGISALEDQHLGGLLMWVPTHMVLFGWLVAICARWLNGEGRGSHLPRHGRNPIRS